MKNIWKHVLVWGIFILYEMSYLSLAAVRHSSVLDYALHYLVNIGLFYFNAAGFNYIFAYRLNRFVGILVLLVLEIVCYIFIQYSLILLFDTMNIPGGGAFFSSWLKLLVHIYRAIYFIGLSIGYWFAVSDARQRRLNFELENSRLKQEKENIDKDNQLMQAQNAYLQSQLNPHLLFNSLNFIYNSVRKVSATAAKAIIILSDMMRYSLSEISIDGKVTLAKEIAHVKNLVDLNQLRFNEGLQVELTLDGDFSTAQIIPLVLISFIENLYKHGDLTDPAKPAKIIIAFRNGVLEMEASNEKKKSTHREEGWGIGIDNTRARLDNYYKGRYELEVTETETRYTVWLSVDLTARV